MILALCGIYAWINRFLLDDAFITFRYARHLAEGLGPVWNPGERVEGYSNFLWMLLLSGVHKLGGDPAQLSQILGIFFYLLNLWMIFLIARMWLAKQRPALVVMALSGMCFTMAAFATGGLETSLYGLFWSISIFIYLKIRDSSQPSIYWFLGLGGVLALAHLTRPDAVLLIIPLGGLLLFHCVREKKPLFKRFVAVVTPLVLIVGGHQIWRVLYYKEWLPNTFYIKGSGNPVWGLLFLALFFFLYGFPLVLFWVLPRLGKLKEVWDETDTERLILILPWLGYLLMIGGDFMEFRMLVPVLPLLYMSAAGWVTRLWPGKMALLIWGVLFLALGLLPPYIYRETFPAGHTLTVFALNRETAEPDQGLIAIGKHLGELFQYDQSIHIATGTAGAIPYYTQAFTTDLLGLNDKWVARNGEIAEKALPGHGRYAPVSYLLERGVHLQLSRWMAPYSLQELESNQNGYPNAEGELWLHFGVEDIAQLPSSSRLLLIPLPNGNHLHTLYLSPHPTVDAVIRERNLALFPLHTGT